MRCHICDKALSEQEIQEYPDASGYEPCATCTEIIMDAAYSDGFVKEEPAEEFDLGEDDFIPEPNETLDTETYRSYYDNCDASYDPDETSYD